MTEQGGLYELNRDGAARAVAIVSLNEPQFLSGLREDPESALWNYGFALSPQETASIRQFFGDRGRDLSDEDVRDLIRRSGQLERRFWPW